MNHNTIVAHHTPVLRNCCSKTFFLLGSADFRLTPEEQDIAYEFKAKVMRKIHTQNQNIKKELELHEKKGDLKKCQQTFKKKMEDQTMSQSTLVKLTNVYEKRAASGEKRAGSDEKEAVSGERKAVLGKKRAVSCVRRVVSCVRRATRCEKGLYQVRQWLYQVRQGLYQAKIGLYADK